MRSQRVATHIKGPQMHRLCPEISIANCTARGPTCCSPRLVRLPRGRSRSAGRTIAAAPQCKSHPARPATPAQCPMTARHSRWRRTQLEPLAAGHSAVYQSSWRRATAPRRRAGSYAPARRRFCGKRRQPLLLTAGIEDLPAESHRPTTRTGQTGRTTRSRSGRSLPGHASVESENEADKSRATETGQVDALATPGRAVAGWAGARPPWIASRPIVQILATPQAVPPVFPPIRSRAMPTETDHWGRGSTQRWERR